MKIKGIKTTPVAIPLDYKAEESLTVCRPACYTAVILELFTEEGLTGIA